MAWFRVQRCAAKKVVRLGSGSCNGRFFFGGTLEEQLFRLTATTTTTTTMTMTTTTTTTGVSVSQGSAASFSSLGSSAGGSSWRLFSSLPESTQTTSTTQSVLPFRLADIGEGIAEVELLEWFVKPGDPIAQFDLVCRVQSDKATVEITSRYDGYIYDLAGHNVGDVIAVGSPLLHVAVQEEEEEEQDKDTGSAALLDDSSSTAADGNLLRNDKDKASTSFESLEMDDRTKLVKTKKKFLATPAVRRLASEGGIDLTTLVGTGPDGRILKADVLQATRQQDTRTLLHTPPPPSSSSPPLPPSSSSSLPLGTFEATKKVKEEEEEEEKEQQDHDTCNEQQQQQQQLWQDSDSVEIPLRGYHRIMAKAMTDSLQVPHMCFTDEINVTALCDCRKDLSTTTTKLSYLPFCIKATSLALMQYPSLNATHRTGETVVTIHRRHDIGIAMDTPRGLAVPVLRNCQDKSILQIAQELARLQAAAKEGALCEADLANPTFTLSNIGAIGGLYMSPIVAVPQVAIGAMGRIQRLPRFVNNESTEVEAVQLMPMSWAADHRVVDGATLARFSNAYKSYMEQPLAMLLTLK